MRRPDDGWRTAWQIATFMPRRYVVAGLGWASVQCIPLLAGLALKAAFDRVSDGPATAGDALPLLAAFVAAEACRGVVIWVANVAWPMWFLGVLALLRGNGLGSVLCDPVPPAVRLPGSSAEAMARLRDDAEDLVWFVDMWVDLAGAVVFTGVAVWIMLAVDPLVTLVVLLPMAAVLIGTRALLRYVRRVHDTSRRSGAAVSALVGELMDGVLALKVAGAEDAALGRLRTANATRGDDAVRAALAVQALEVWAYAAVEVTVGLILLLGAPAMRRGDFTVGDLALFMLYASSLTSLPRLTGRLLARHRQATVAVERLAVLAPDGRPEAVAAHGPVYLSGPPPAVPAPARDGDGLERLEGEGFTVRHPGTGRGVVDAGLLVQRGELTVITGAVGSGKTTLLRGVLGLLPAEAGVLRWNGAPVAEPAVAMVPPRCAYVPQAPRLLSDTLRENVVLGWPADDRALTDALWRAALDDDLTEMESGLDTVVGPRGARLSGGQVLRTAAARAVVRRPDLLVLDDVSSGLDVEVERQLWDRLLGEGVTCLAVSHRRAPLRRADRIVVLEEGRVVGTGRLPDLLEDCEEMRRLWRDESVVEEEEAMG